MDETDIEVLTEHLNSVGCDEHEISQILVRLRDLEQQTIHQSVFDSIASGSFNLHAIINEVRAQEADDEGDEGDQNASKP